MAFKMKGFSYPGQSPLKGKKKKADIAAAKEDRLVAQEKIKEFGDKEMKSTSILDSEGFSIQGGGVAPVKKLSPMKEGETTVEDKADANYYGSEKDVAKNTTKKSFGDSFKGAMGSEIGKTVGNALATAGVNAIMGTLTKPKKKKPKRQAANVSGFSNIKMGRK